MAPRRSPVKPRIGNENITLKLPRQGSAQTLGKSTTEVPNPPLSVLELPSRKHDIKAEKSCPEKKR